MVGMKKHTVTFTEEAIIRLNQPICCSTAVNSCAEAKNSKLVDAENLYNNLFLAKGSRVVLTRNLWSEAGLDIGSLGFVQG